MSPPGGAALEVLLGGKDGQLTPKRIEGLTGGDVAEVSDAQRHLLHPRLIDPGVGQLADLPLGNGDGRLTEAKLYHGLTTIPGGAGIVETSTLCRASTR